MRRKVMGVLNLSCLFRSFNLRIWYESVVKNLLFTLSSLIIKPKLPSLYILRIYPTSIKVIFLVWDFQGVLFEENWSLNFVDAVTQHIFLVAAGLCFPAFCGGPFLLPVYWHLYNHGFLLHKSLAVRRNSFRPREILFSEFTVHASNEKINIHIINAPCPNPKSYDFSVF